MNLTSVKSDPENYIIQTVETLEPVDVRTLAANPGISSNRIVKKTIIHNYDGNIKWPLDYCPKCKSNLTAVKPITIRVMSLASLLSPYISVFLFYILYVFLSSLGSFIVELTNFKPQPIFLYFYILISITGTITGFIKCMSKFYICSKCHCLLFHTKHDFASIKKFDDKYQRIFK